MLRKLLSKLITLLIIGWIIVIAYDYYLVTNEEEPKFCIESGTTKYPDGTVKWCKGVGYKSFNYDRSSFKAMQFGPFWIKEQKIVKE